MYSFSKDIKFMEELKTKGFNNTYCLTLVNDKNFYTIICLIASKLLIFASHQPLINIQQTLHLVLEEPGGIAVFDFVLED